jgi:hypothetical protein
VRWTISLFVFAFQKCFWKNLIFVCFKLIFFVFRIILICWYQKLFLKNKKKQYYFNIFSNKIYFKNQLLATIRMHECMGLEYLWIVIIYGRIGNYYIELGSWQGYPCSIKHIGPKIKLLIAALCILLMILSFVFHARDWCSFPPLLLPSTLACLNFLGYLDRLIL